MSLDQVPQKTPCMCIAHHLWPEAELTFTTGSHAPPPQTMSASMRSKKATDAAGAGLLASTTSRGSRIKSA